MSQAVWALAAADQWTDEREANLLDGGAPFYSVYERSDGRHVAVGALERRFYRAALAGLALSDEGCPINTTVPVGPSCERGVPRSFEHDRATSGGRGSKERMHASRLWLNVAEAEHDPHLVARRTLRRFHGVAQPAPAPRFSRSSVDDQAPPPQVAGSPDELLAAWSLDLPTGLERR